MDKITLNYLNKIGTIFEKQAEINQQLQKQINHLEQEVFHLKEMKKWIAKDIDAIERKIQ